jgi:SAM-dependent methyltransferase
MPDRILPKYSGRPAILELGCGRRKNAMIDQFRHADPLVVKLDIDKNSLRTLSFLEHSSAHISMYVNADAQVLPFSDGSFNVILWRNLLDFIPKIDSGNLTIEENTARIEQERARFFKGLFRVLTPGGLIISDDIADTDGLYIFKGQLAVDLRSFAGRTDLAATAASSGFEIIRRDVVSGLSIFRKPG